jgi:hypothetical protein
VSENNHNKRNAVQKLLLIYNLLKNGYKFDDDDRHALIDSLKESIQILEIDLKELSKS